MKKRNIFTVHGDVRIVTAILGTRKHKGMRRKKQVVREAGSGLLKLFISLFFKYVFKSQQVHAHPDPCGC